MPQEVPETFLKFLCATGLHLSACKVQIALKEALRSSSSQEWILALEPSIDQITAILKLFFFYTCFRIYGKWIPLSPSNVFCKDKNSLGKPTEDK